MNSPFVADGRHNIPGFYPPYGPGAGGYNYLHVPPHPRRGQHSSASSVRSSKTGHSRRQGFPHPMMHYSPYGYYPVPYPSYGYPYPQYGVRLITILLYIHVALIGPLPLPIYPANYIIGSGITIIDQLTLLLFP